MIDIAQISYFASFHYLIVKKCLLSWQSQHL